ncbi:MAG: hypothetical protein ACLGI3_21275 [Actinomycetes bacterium]
MQDAEDAAIVRQVVRVVAAMIFCLLCGGISGIFIVQDDYRDGAGQQQVELPPSTRPQR